MELKQAGVLCRTLSAMEQELLSIYQNCDQAELTMAAASLHQARCHLVRSTAVSTNSSEEEVCIRMGLSSST